MALIHRTKQPKYNNKKVVYDNIKFDSKKEMTRYAELKLLEKAKKITDLELQKKFIIQDKFKINGKTIRAITYNADFTYFTTLDNKLHIEDVKGSKNIITEVFKIKKKLFEYKYKTEIELII